MYVFLNIYIFILHTNLVNIIQLKYVYMSVLRRLLATRQYPTFDLGSVIQNFLNSYYINLTNEARHFYKT